LIGPAGVLIVGAGQAGYQLAVSLREGGYDGPVRLVGDEPGLPYQRPPLSKGYLQGDGVSDLLAFRPQAYFDKHAIEVRGNTRVAAIDRTGHRVVTEASETLDYAHLVLATGTRNRPLLVPGHDLAGVHALRTHAEAEALRVGIQAAAEMVVVGAGFLGLEAAAVAAARGTRVDVVETTQLPMGRAVSAVVSQAFTRHHQRQGIRMHLGVGVARLHGAQGQVTGVELSNGTTLPTSLALVCIGVIPNTELAAEAGLPVANGIVVDEFLATEDPAISAIGDCAAYPNRYANGAVRLESVQNAVDHARCLAARLLGKPAPYHAVPWFWSDQGEWKLQIAGFTAGCDTFVPRGDVDGRDFIVYAFRDGRLAGVETVNRPADHVAARRLLATTARITPEMVAAPDFDLRRATKAALS